MKPQVHILVSPDCAHASETEALVRDVISDSGIDAELSVVRIFDAEQAKRSGFLGSPTVQVNGLDIDPTARARTFSGFA